MVYVLIITAVIFGGHEITKVHGPYTEKECKVIESRLALAKAHQDLLDHYEEFHARCYLVVDRRR